MISNIDQMTRRELVEIVKIQVEEFQELHKRVAELEQMVKTILETSRTSEDFPKILDAAERLLGQPKGQDE